MSPSDDEFRCGSCGASDWGAFVQHGSYVLRCLKCGKPGVATSYIAVGPRLHGRTRAVLVDEALREQALVAEGEGAEIYEAVKKAAGEGGLVWLQPMEGPEDTRR